MLNSPQHSVSLYQFTAIVLDFDGVVADSESAQLEAWKWALERHNCQVGQLKPREIVGWIDEEIIGRLLPAGSPEELRLAVLESKVQRMREMYEAFAIPPVPRVIDFIKRKSVTHVLAVATNSRSNRAQLFCESYGISKYLSAIVGGRREVRPKPNPDIYLRLLKELTLSAQDCVVIEDSIPGLQAARLSGMKTIGITTVIEKDDLVPFANWVVDSFEQLE